ncbi:MAG3090 family protein [Mycoplasmopsis iners]|uniref:MAG3090 family protein n=1 Tax=Mycoplasmopsis iners TaxID=76630 RepID=UPI0006919FEC|nr:hypothetical protein [Mycoplasmopsis iners]
MKRLLCYYEPKKDSMYPWLLKHPKIKVGLAKFKTRKEAMQWYMLLKFETSVWFQNENRIWGGQLTIDNEGNEWNNYIKVSGFDGGENYEAVCEEFAIDPRTFQFDYKKAEKRLKDLDFVLLHDPYTYFPAELEIAKKSRKEMIDLDQLNLLKEKYEEKITVLEKELKEQSEKTQEVRIETKYIKEGKTYVVHYEEFLNLTEDKQLDALALYLTKIKEVIKHTEKQTIAVTDYDRIMDNIERLDEVAAIAKNKANEENKKLFEKVLEQIKHNQLELLKKFEVNQKLNDVPEHFAYYYNEGREEKISVAYEVSYVLLGLLHVGFVKLNEYQYPVDYVIDPSKYGVAIIADEAKEVATPVVVQPKEEVITKVIEKEVIVYKQDMPEFWTGAVQPLTPEYINDNQLVKDENNIYKPSKWYTAWLLLLVLLILGVIAVIVLFILQLAGVVSLFNV